MTIKNWSEPRFKTGQLLSADDILKLLLSLREDEFADIVCEAIARSSAKVLEAVTKFVNS